MSCCTCAPISVYLLFFFRFSLHQSLSTSCSLTHSSHALSFSPPFPSFLSSLSPSLHSSLPPFLPPFFFFLSPSFPHSLRFVRSYPRSVPTVRPSCGQPHGPKRCVRLSVSYYTIFVDELLITLLSVRLSVCPSLCLSHPLTLRLSLSQTLPLGGQFVTWFPAWRISSDCRLLGPKSECDDKTNSWSCDWLWEIQQIMWSFKKL